MLSQVTMLYTKPQLDTMSGKKANVSRDDEIRSAVREMSCQSKRIRRCKY